MVAMWRVSELCWFVSKELYKQVAKSTLLVPIKNVQSGPQLTAPSQSPPLSNDDDRG